MYKNLIELSDNIDVNRRISCICILNKGIILPVNKKGMQNIELLPNMNTVYAMIKNADDALLLFYLVLTQILNSITIFPPDMVVYAQSTGILDTSLFIPTDYVPDDGTINIMDKMASIAEIKGLRDYGLKILSGKLKKDELLECAFKIYIPSLRLMHGELDKVPNDSVLNFFGIPISNRVLIKAYEIYKNQDNATREEKINLDKLEEFMYAIYDSHRAEMLNQSNDK